MTILMQRYAHTPARLSPYFMQGILQPQERSERGRFLFLMVAMTARTCRFSVPREEAVRTRCAGRWRRKR